MGWLSVGFCQGPGLKFAVRNRPAASSRPAQSPSPCSEPYWPRGFQEWNSMHQDPWDLVKSRSSRLRIPGPPAGLPAGPSSKGGWAEKPWPPARGRPMRPMVACQLKQLVQADRWFIEGNPPGVPRNRPWWARAAFSNLIREQERNQPESIRDVRALLAPLRCRNGCPAGAPSPSLHEMVHAPFGGWGPNRLLRKLDASCSPHKLFALVDGESRRPEKLLAWPPRIPTSFVAAPATGAAAMYSSTALSCRWRSTHRPLWLPLVTSAAAPSGAKGILTANRTSCMSAM